MRKAKILGAALVAVIAFAALSAGSASANQWLKNGAAIATKEPAVTKGTWKIIASTLFGGKITLECNGELRGTVGPGAEDEVTAATDLAGKKVIDCKILTNTTPCMGTLTLVEAEHLPWKTKLAGTLEDFFESSGAGKPAFDVKCELSTGSFTLELCEGNVKSDTLKNITGGVEGRVLKVKSEKCNGFGNSSEVEANGTTSLSSGTLTVS